MDAGHRRRGVATFASAKFFVPDRARAWDRRGFVLTDRDNVAANALYEPHERRDVVAGTSGTLNAPAPQVPWHHFEA